MRHESARIARPAASAYCRVMGLPAKLATPRAALLAVFAAFGATIGSFAGSIPEIMRNAGIGSFEFGLAQMLGTLSTIVAMTLAGAASRRFSNRAVLLVFLPLIAVTGFAMMTSPSPLVFYATSIAFGAAMGGNDIFMNAEGSAIEHDLQRPVFTAFHGILSLFIPIFALLGSWISVAAGPWLISLMSGAALAAAWVFVYRNVPARALASGQGGRIAALPRKMPLILIGIVSGLCISAEISAIVWSAKLLDDQAPQLAAIAGAGAAFYGICNAAIRFRGDGLRARFGDLPVLIASLCVAIAGFALLGMSVSFAMSVGAFAIIGFGAALLTPCAFSLAAAQTPQNRAAGLSFVSAVSGLPRTLAPWAFGWIALHQGVGFTFGLLAAVLTVALAITVALRSLTADLTIAAQRP
jgi:MFS family permease